ncbi:MAG: peptide deformylase [Candidatus Pacebacteria bacterium]|nr:peptide deformylase [Candidatus Paceibacterota bacterium]
MINILQIGNPTLRKIAKEVPKNEIKSSEVQRVITKMKKAISEHDDGIAIAAPQIGESVRIFLISKIIFTFDDEGRTLPDMTPEKMKEFEDLIFINPEITKFSKKTQWLSEGCLSVIGVYGKVQRSEKVTVKAFNEKGEPFTRGASKLLAQTIQHENDHLDGILFCDKAKDLEEIDMFDDKK